MIRIAIVDDHAMIRAGLKQFFADQPDFTVVAEATNGRDALDIVRGGEVDVLGGKTGFISKAGYCLATLLRLPQGNQVAVVVLGASSNTGRFWETRHLANWLSDKAGDIFRKQE